jgi:hypothetical protein
VTEQTQEQPKEKADVATMKLPIVLSVAEIQGILSALRKFPMEQVETLVMNIQTQANQIIASMQAQSVGEDK